MRFHESQIVLKLTLAQNDLEFLSSHLPNAEICRPAPPLSFAGWSYLPALL